MKTIGYEVHTPTQARPSLEFFSSFFSSGLRICNVYSWTSVEEESSKKMEENSINDRHVSLVRPFFSSLNPGQTLIDNGISLELSYTRISPPVANTLESIGRMCPVFLPVSVCRAPDWESPDIIRWYSFSPNFSVSWLRSLGPLPLWTVA